MIYGILESPSKKYFNNEIRNTKVLLEKINERNKKRKVIVITEMPPDTSEWKNIWGGEIDERVFFVNLDGERTQEYQVDTVLIIINGICDAINITLYKLQKKHRELHKEKMDAAFLFNCEKDEEYGKEMWQRITPGKWLSLIEPDIYYKYSSKKFPIYPYTLDSLAINVKGKDCIKSSVTNILSRCIFL